MAAPVAPRTFRLITTVPVALFLSLVAVQAAAVPIYFEPTGHYYEFVQSPAVRWTDAHLAAGTRSWDGFDGYLATITSAEENDFVFTSFGAYFWEAWLGGCQEPTSDPPAEWRWMTGETWDYTNWASGEPNDAGGSDKECYLQMWGEGTTSPGFWNDDALDTHPGNVSGYLVEYGTTLPVPEPSSATLLIVGLGLGALAFRRRFHVR